MTVYRFIVAMSFAFCLIAPLCWVAIRYDINRTTPWPKAVRIVWCALVVAILVSATVWAAEIIDPATYCEQMKADGVSWWILVFLGCW